MKIKLLLIAITGTLAGYWIINTFIQPMGFLQYLGIELLITVFHALYNLAKKEAIN